MKRSDLKDIIKNLKFPENTLELINLKENLVLNDTYNLSE
jgi:hypothetical protein